MSAQRVPVAPEPDAGAHAARHAAAARDHIANDIAERGGWISFERYMDLALYAPGIGYYSAGAHKLGKAGDFTTAPEISGLFGACIARQCAEVLDAMDAGSLLEIGAGTGRLAVDVLRALEQRGRLPDRYLILETSADLRERQRSLIREQAPRLHDRVAWLDAPPGQAFDGIILANEVLDALPVVRFRWSRAASEELGVVCRDGGFAWAARPAGPALAAACNRLAAAAGGEWDDGYVSEYCPRLAHWSHAVTDALRRGLVLWIDYGLPRAQYYLPERQGGTLLSHFRHAAAESPFAHPGLEDLTAWVDFTALAEAGAAAGWQVAGFATQALFLAGTGIDVAMQLIAAGDDGRFARLAAEARRLLMPGEMGERFKVMGWTRGVERSWCGFALQDLRHTL